MNHQEESREEKLARLRKRDAEQDAEIERLRCNIAAQNARIAELEKELKCTKLCENIYRKTCINN